MSNCLSKRIHLVSEMFTVLLHKELFGTKGTTDRQKEKDKGDCVCCSGRAGG